MSLYLYIAETVDSVRSKVVGYAQSGRPKITNWISGGVGQQILEAVANTVAGLTVQQARAIRGFASLDTSVDPGDADPYDPGNAALAPDAGYLSDKGSNEYGTGRIGETEATGSINFINTGAGAVNQSLPAFSVTFQRDTADADGFQPTYRNSAAIVCGAGVSLTAALGTAVPIICETAGTSGNASAGHVTILVTTLPGVTVTNPAAVLGTDRQSAEDYREACREAAALTSPNGPSDAYRYLATTGRDDGTWGNSTTGNSLGITKIQVSGDSTTGTVDVYYAGASGGAALSGTVLATTGPMVGMTFVQAANYLISQTPGVISVPDGFNFGPSGSGGVAATDVTVNVTYTVKALASSVPGSSAGTYTTGGSPPAVVAAVFAAIDAAYDAFFIPFPMAGDDQTAGAGVLYTDDLLGVLYRVPLASGVILASYGCAVSVPAAGGSTALALGHDAIYGTGTGTLILT